MTHEIDRSDLEDLQAPHGRCHLCKRPFGMQDKNGFIVYQFDRSCCTECHKLDRERNSRDYDQQYVNANNGRGRRYR